MKPSAEFHQSTGFTAFLTRLNTAALRQGALRGLNEHAGEQRRQSVTRIAATTHVPKGRVSRVTKVIKASAGGLMVARVRTADKAISLAEYGNPSWSRSSIGARATAWGVSRVFKGTFVAKGQVYRRISNARYPLKKLSGAVLANELAKPTRPNVPAAEKFAAFDLQKRVIRHTQIALGV